MLGVKLPELLSNTHQIQQGSQPKLRRTKCVITLVLQYRKDIVYSLNDLVVGRIKRVGLSSYSLVSHSSLEDACCKLYGPLCQVLTCFLTWCTIQLLPIWREVTNLVADPTLVGCPCSLFDNILIPLFSFHHPSSYP